MKNIFILLLVSSFIFISACQTHHSANTGAAGGIVSGSVKGTNP